jgi:tetratricopeptide (TPR) repeat protein
MRIHAVTASVVLLAGVLSAQQAPTQNEPPRSQSSSKDTKIDLSPPPGEAGRHPDSTSDDESGVSEFKPWNPHKADKDVEVGDYYFKEKNYRAALSRYQEALEYKPRDARATFKIAQTQEKLGNIDDARANYEGYLKILPNGPDSAASKKALEKLKASSADAQQ